MLKGNYLFPDVEMKRVKGDNMWRHKNNQIGALVNYKLRSNYKNCQAYIQVGDRLLWSLVQRKRYKGMVFSVK